MQLNLAKAAGSKKAIDVSDQVFGVDYNETLVHQIVTAYLADARAGTVAQKSRSEVRGGGAKPWRQKGTGRARAGTINSPLWRSGGVTFAAKPRNYSQKVNKKMYRAAMRSILSELVRQERLLIVDDFAIDEPKTKVIVAKLKEHELKNVLVITEAVDQKLYLASRNLHWVDIRDVVGADPVSLISYEKVLMTVAAVKQLEELLG